MPPIAIFTTCMASPDVTTPPPGDARAVRTSGFDGDLDVDLSDLAVFQLPSRARKLKESVSVGEQSRLVPSGM